MYPARKFARTVALTDPGKREEMNASARQDGNGIQIDGMSRRWTHLLNLDQSFMFFNGTVLTRTERGIYFAFYLFSCRLNVISVHIFE